MQTNTSKHEACCIESFSVLYQRCQAHKPKLAKVIRAFMLKLKGGHMIVYRASSQSWAEDIGGGFASAHWGFGQLP
jgi:hypothetical protein